MKAKFTITGEIEIDECYMEGEDKMTTKDIQEAVTDNIKDNLNVGIWDMGELKEDQTKITVTISQ